MRRKIAAKTTGPTDAKSYFGQAYPEGYGKNFTSGYTGKVQGQSKDDDKKFNYNIPGKGYTSSGHKLNQNETDAGTQFKEVSKSWQNQDKGFLNVVKAAQNIINERFAKMKKSLDTAGESLYKGIDVHPLKEELYKNFRGAGYDADTAQYIIESSFDESAENMHTALITAAEDIYKLEGVEFAKKLATISGQDRVASDFLETDENLDDTTEMGMNFEGDNSQQVGQSGQENNSTIAPSEEGQEQQFKERDIKYPSLAGDRTVTSFSPGEMVNKLLLDGYIKEEAIAHAGRVFDVSKEEALQEYENDWSDRVR